ncbi:MAG: BadF/BadG/BcrA/BcrD ATPase family protein [Elusimicrobia bacterium]|nr:BadF/BadG/BcrA/BcrD ATPase family protein [Elusimicrobiota bacterium]
MKKEFFLGIDGGASKTAAVLTDSEGNILSDYKTSGIHISSLGKPQLKSCLLLLEVIQTICKKGKISPKDVRFFSFGLSGIDFDDQQPIQLKEISRVSGIPKEKIILVNDAIIALWGATPNPAAGLFSHGSSFTNALRPKYGNETLFHHLCLAVSTYDLRTEVFVRILRMIEGREKSTPLKRKIMKFLNIKSDDVFCRKLYLDEIHWREKRATARIIYNEWLKGDTTAAYLVNKAIDEYVLIAITMINKIDSESAHIVFGGGVINNAPRKFWKILVKKIHNSYPNVVVKPPDLPPEYGAVVLAADKAGYEPQEYFKKILATKSRI